MAIVIKIGEKTFLSLMSKITLIKRFIKMLLLRYRKGKDSMIFYYLFGAREYAQFVMRIMI